MDIKNHEGSKYLRTIYTATNSLNPGQGREASIDVYSVLEAFGVTCPARQHAIKKLLCAGLRGKGSELNDPKGALAAVNRAIELQDIREIEVKGKEDRDGN